VNIYSCFNILFRKNLLLQHLQLQFERDHLLVFSDNFGMFRSVSKQFCLFRLFRYRFETPKQTETNENYYFLVSRNKPKQTRNRSCFGLFRFEPKFIFVCFEDTLEVKYFCQKFSDFYSEVSFISY